MQNFSNYTDSCSLSEQLLQRSLFAAVDAILSAIITSHTPKCSEWAKNAGKLLIVAKRYSLSLLSLCRLRITTQLRSGAVDKMADIYTKRIWQT